MTFTRQQQTTIKILFAFTIAILLAWLFELPGTVTTGILAIISIQPTKTDTVLVMIRRLISASLGFAFAYLAFELFGYTLLIYTIVGVVFTVASFATSLGVGVVPTLVLLGTIMTHGSYEFTVLLQTSLMLIISIVVSALVTFLYPSSATKALEVYAATTDDVVQQMLTLFSSALTTPNNQLPYQDSFAQWDIKGKAIITEAEVANKDFLFAKDNSLYAYLKMRQSQMNRVRRLFRLLQSIDQPTPFAQGILDFLTELIPAIGAVDKATALRTKLLSLTKDYRQKPLPTTREEFEIRAILFQMLFELDYFLSIKIQYHNQLAN
jgi:uncharacterized membrane protein YgaE (UPF0421/DUF939 family)